MIQKKRTSDDQILLIVLNNCRFTFFIRPKSSIRAEFECIKADQFFVNIHSIQRYTSFTSQTSKDGKCVRSDIRSFILFTLVRSNINHVLEQTLSLRWLRTCSSSSWSFWKPTVRNSWRRYSVWQFWRRISNRGRFWWRSSVQWFWRRFSVQWFWRRISSRWLWRKLWVVISNDIDMNTYVFTTVNSVKK